MQNKDAEFWEGRARQLRRVVNGAWWLEAFAPRWTLLALASAVLLLALRSGGYGISVGTVVFAVMILAAVWALWGGRKRFLKREASLARLDWELGLNNQLTTAHAGLASWPERAAWRPVWRWNPAKLFPHVLSLAVLAAAAWVPIPEKKMTPLSPPSAPMAWTQAEQMLEILRRSGVPEPQALDELERRLADMRAQNPSDWYKHASLEAGEHLRESLHDGARALAETIARSAAIADAARKAGAGMTESSRARLEQSFEKMRQDMAAGSIPPGAEWKELLEGVNPDSVRQMSEAQWQEMREKLEEGLQVCAECLGETGEGLPTLAEQSFGEGDIQRGPGEAPLFLKEQEPKNASSRPEGLPASEETPLPGDVVKITAGDHEVDENAWQGPVATGSSPIQAGGDAVWKQNVTLEESETIRRYFQ